MTRKKDHDDHGDRVTGQKISVRVPESQPDRRRAQRRWHNGSSETTQPDGKKSVRSDVKKNIEEKKRHSVRQKIS